jgi:hypothetical protein
MAWGFSSLAMIQVESAVGGDAVADVAMSSAVRTKETATASTPAEGEFQIDLVFFGERGNADGDAGQVDALVFAEHAAVDDLADDVVAIDFMDAQFDEAVGEQDAGAGLDVFGEGLEGGADEGGGAFDFARGDGDRFAGDEHGPACGPSLPVRILGPCRSARMQSGLRSSRLTLRIIWMRASLSSCVPWEKLRRATSRPARTSWRKDRLGVGSRAEGRDDLGAPLQG